MNARTVVIRFHVVLAGEEAKTFGDRYRRVRCTVPFQNQDEQDAGLVYVPWTRLADERLTFTDRQPQFARRTERTRQRAISCNTASNPRVNPAASPSELRATWSRRVDLNFDNFTVSEASS